MNKSNIIKFKPERNERWYDTGDKYLGLYTKSCKYQTYIYFIIHGEYINLNKNIKEVIIDALYDLFNFGTINTNNYFQDEEKKSRRMIKVPEYRLVTMKEFIINNFRRIVWNIKELELFFDLDAGSIQVKEHKYVFNTNDPAFRSKLQCFQKSADYSKENALIVKDSTIYSKDYHFKRRPSTLKIYNRKVKILKVNNQYTMKKIEEYPYNTRIELLLTNINTGYRLNIENLDGTYSDIIFKYASLLEVFFTKYIHNFSISNVPHLHYFQILYEQSLLNPHKKYNGSTLTVFKQKRLTRFLFSNNFTNFSSSLHEEYKSIRDSYLMFFNKFIKHRIRDTKYDYTQSRSYSMFDLCIDDGSTFSIGDEYMPIKIQHYNVQNNK